MAEKKKKRTLFGRSKKRSIVQDFVLIGVACILIYLLTRNVLLTLAVVVLLVIYDTISYRSLDPGILIHECDPEKYLEYLDLNLRTQRIPFFRANILIKAVGAHLEANHLDQVEPIIESLEAGSLSTKQQQRITVLKAGYYAAIDDDFEYNESYAEVEALPAEYKKTIDVELLTLYNALRRGTDEEFFAIRDKIAAYDRLPRQKWVILHFLCCRHCAKINDQDGYDLSFGVVEQYGNRLKYKSLLTGQKRTKAEDEEYEMKQLKDQLERMNQQIRLPDQM